MKDFKKMQEMDRRARELAGLYAEEKARADKLEAELREKRTCKESLQVGNALSTAPRNCDRQFQNAHDVLSRFTAETGRQIFNTTDVVDWLLFAEAKGGAK